MADQQPKSPQQIQIPIPAEVLRGSYANTVSVSYTGNEFILDFAAINPAQGNGVATNRIFVSPTLVKQMIELLNRMVSQFESQKGESSMPAYEQTSEIGFKT